MTVTLQASRTYYPLLDGVRAIGIVLVFVSHYILPIVPGAFGVDIFFLLSGFLITRLLLNERQQNGSINLRRFYMRRALRLMPAMFVMVFFVSIYWYNYINKFSPIEILAAIFYFANYYIIFTPPILPIGPLWSLAVEEHYYILFPIIVLFFGANSNRLIQFSIAFIIAVTLWRYVILSVAIDLDYIKHASDTRMDAIAWGALMAALADNPKTRFVVSSCSNLFTMIFGAGLIIVGLSFALTNSALLQGTARYSFTHIGLFLVFLYVLFSPNAAPLTALLRTPVICYLGRLSYSIYLYHWAVLKAGEAANLSLTRPMLLALCTGLTLFFAIASYHLIEMPLASLRRRMGSNL